jgi:hypothetical protein
LSEWQFLKNRTAADGAVWRSAEGQLYLRTGGVSVLAEAQHQRDLAEAGYPVPEITEAGESDADCYFIERTAGAASLHELAIADTARAGRVSDEVLTQVSASRPGCYKPRPAARWPPPRPSRSGSSAPDSPLTCARRTPTWTPPGSTTRSPAR